MTETTDGRLKPVGDGMPGPTPSDGPVSDCRRVKTPLTRGRNMTKRRKSGMILPAR